jgi:hypothetical protein
VRDFFFARGRSSAAAEEADGLIAWAINSFRINIHPARWSSAKANQYPLYVKKFA